jgi:sporulation protein YlmC with PRC-barrel domain
VHLIRDLLDKAVVDRNGREMGRVDRVVLERRNGEPRVTAIVIGASALADRLDHTLGRWVMGLLHGLGVADGQPVRIHVSQILAVTDAVKVDVAFGDTPAANLERSLRGLIRRIPGARR